MEQTGRITSRALLAAAAVLVAAPASAAPLVVRSAGPSAKLYPPGKALSEAQPVVLKAGDVVTVLAPSSTRTLRGPGTFTVAGGRNAAPTAFNPRSRFGAMRGTEVPPAPGLWDVDVSKGGNFCVAEPARLLLWRPAGDAEATLHVAPNGGAGAAVRWGAGSHMLRWPQQLPIADGSEYSLKLADGEAARLKFRAVAATEDDPTALASAFIDKGCETQLDRLIASTPEE
jgi:hypothetical protein